MRRKVLLTAVVLAIVALADNPVVYAEGAKEDPKPKTALTNGIITDAETGLQFRKAHSLVGERDFIIYTNELNLSPNGKFLLWLMQVIPLDGGKPFKLVDFSASRGVWSPDGKKLAFYSGGIWVIPVSPDTGKAAGSPKKLVEGQYWYQYQVCWSPDSEKIAFTKDSRLWACSVRDGAMVQITDEPRFYRMLGAWSPDGKSIICTRDDGKVCLISIEGGQPREIFQAESRALPRWSPDSKWIFYQWRRKLRFVRVADALRVDLTLPEGVERSLPWSPGGKKLFFYTPSYDSMWTAKVVSAGGGPSFEPGREAGASAYWHQWSPDSKFIVTEGERGGEWGYWVIPIAGDKPFRLELDVPLEGQLVQVSFSPDARRLLFGVIEAGKEKGHWVVPVSVREGRTTGTPVKVFDEPGAERFTWSPDGTKVAILCQDDLWTASADGRSAVRLTKTPEREVEPQWSADGTGIAWISYSPSSRKSNLFVKRLPREEPKKLVETSRWLEYMWSPDGTRIAYRDYDLDESVLSVIAVSGTEPRKVINKQQEGYREVRYTWSPDGTALTVMAGDKISAYSFPGGDLRVIADLKRLPLRRYSDLRWSPDGRSLGFILAHKPRDPPPSDFRPGDLATDRTWIYTVSAKGGEPTELAADDPAGKYSLRWSPDGNWLSYDAYYYAKARSEGIIWEVEIDEYLKREAEKASTGSSASHD
jgi:Tol biopolymer transport system component